MGWVTNKKRKITRRIAKMRKIKKLRLDTSWYRQGGSRGYVTVLPIDWGVGRKGSLWRHRIPEGFEFESSVPIWLRWVLSPDHPYFLFPAAIHDSLIESAYERPLCDGEWLSAARFVRAPKFLREFGYLAIRLKQLYRGLTHNETS